MQDGRGLELVVSLCRKMLAGEISYVLGSRRLLAVAGSAGLDRNNLLLARFIAIESETETIPDEAVRRHWSRAALARLEGEWNAAENWAASVGKSACEALLAQLDGHGERKG